MVLQISLRPKISKRFSRPNGKFTITQIAPASGSSGQNQNGPGKMEGWKGCIPQTFTTTPTQLVPLISRETCQSYSDLMAQVSVDLFALQSSSMPNFGNWDNLKLQIRFDSGI